MVKKAAFSSKNAAHVDFIQTDLNSYRFRLHVTTGNQSNVTIPEYSGQFRGQRKTEQHLPMDGRHRHPHGRPTVAAHHPQAQTETGEEAP